MQLAEVRISLALLNAVFLAVKSRARCNVDVRKTRDVARTWFRSRSTLQTREEALQ